MSLIKDMIEASEGNYISITGAEFRKKTRRLNKKGEVLAFIGGLSDQQFELLMNSIEGLYNQQEKG